MTGFMNSLKHKVTKIFPFTDLLNSLSSSREYEATWFAKECVTYVDKDVGKQGEKMMENDQYHAASKKVTEKYKVKPTMG